MLYEYFHYSLSAESHYSLRVHENDPLVCASVLNSLSMKQLNLTEARYRLRTHNLIEWLDSTILTKSEAWSEVLNYEEKTVCI